MSPGSVYVSLFVGNIQASKSSWFSSLIPLKPSGYYTYHQFNIQQLYVNVFCVDLRTNSDYLPTQYQLTGFYNLEEVFTARYVLDIFI